MATKAMVQGEKPPESRWQQLAKALLIRAFFSPLTLMGVGLAWVGILSLGPRKDIPELWICLPAGLTLLVLLQGILWWVTIWLPRHTVQRFVLEGNNLALETRAHGPFVCPLEGIEKVTPSKNRRGRIKGWWIRCRKEGWIFLEEPTANAGALVAQLESHTPGRAANAGSGIPPRG